MNKTALITGASSGIGAELAREHAKKGGNLILVARRKELLETLKQELEQQYSVSVLAICKDLNQPDATHGLYEQTKDLNVEILINNAGFGLLGAFDQAEIDKIESMIHVNVMALTTLTRLFLPDMLRRNSGKILNIASTASFMPGPLQAVYFATKAYVRSLSWALSEEVRNSSVTVTTLCPGPTRTEFEEKSKMSGTALFEKAKSAQKVAQAGYNAMMKGKRNIVTDRGQHFLIKLLPFVPTKLSLSITRKLQETQPNKNK